MLPFISFNPFKAVQKLHPWLPLSKGGHSYSSHKNIHTKSHEIHKSTPTSATSGEMPSRMDFNPLISESKSILKSLETKVMEIANQGTSDGGENIPLPNETAPSEQAMEAAGNECRALLDQHWHDSSAHLKHQKEEAQKTLDDAKSLEDITQQLEGEKKHKLAEAEWIMNPNIKLDMLNSGHHRKVFIPSLIAKEKENLRQTEMQLKQAEVAFHHLLDGVYRGTAPIRHWLNHQWRFLLAMLVIAGIEFQVNIDALQSIGAGANSAILFIAFIFCVGQAICAKALGEYLQKGNKQLSHIAFFFTLAFVLIMSGTRFMMEEVSWVVKGVYVLVNVFLAVFTSWLSYRRAENKVFFDAQHEVNRLAHSKEAQKAKIKEWEDNYQKVCEKVELEIEQKARSLWLAEKKWLKKAMNQRESEWQQLCDHKQHCEKQIQQILEKALLQYRHLNSLARQRHGHPPVPHWKKPRSNGNDPINGMLPIFSALLLIILTCMGCSHNHLPEQHIDVMIDHTDSLSNHDPKDLTGYVLDQIEWDTIHKTWGDVHINLSQIGDLSTQQVYHLSLQASESDWWSRNEYELKKRARSFKTELEQAMVQLTHDTPEMPHSYIWRNIRERLHHLSQQRGKRTLVSCSDLIANEPGLNLYRYRKHPEQIWQHRDSLLAKMTEGYPIPSVEGIHWINVHQPDKQHDELHEASKRLWRYHAESHGMEIHFLANFPGHQNHALHLTERHGSNPNEMGLPHSQKEHPSIE